jgi:hypothetical protein
VAADGVMDFDFDGYRHRQCRKDHEAIRRQLLALLDAGTGDVEVHWKEPAPLRRGAGELDLPTRAGRHLHR